MSDTFRDRFDIEALRGEFADAAIQRDYDRFVELFTDDGHWAIPDMGVEFHGRADIRAGIEHMLGLWHFFVQTTHPGVIDVHGDTATGRAYVSEIGSLKDGTAQLNYATYHDEYRRTEHGWRFAARRYQFLYVDTSPLAGRAPGGASH